VRYTLHSVVSFSPYALDKSTHSWRNSFIRLLICYNEEIGASKSAVPTHVPIAQLAAGLSIIVNTKKYYSLHFFAFLNRSARLYPEAAATIASVISDAERDGCPSHGLFRLPGYVYALQHAGADGKV